MKRLLFLLLFSCSAALADGVADNLSENVRRQPPAGVAIPEELRATLSAEAQRLGAAIEDLRGKLQDKPELRRHLPDVQIFHKAVDWALRYDEIFDPKQGAWAMSQLQDGFARLDALAQGQLPWLEARGLVVRGYQSKIDGSIQPFGLVVPESFQKNLPWRWRLDCWFHGRGETLTELDFIHQRQNSPGEFTPPDALVLHPYGRYNNGQRFAGETDFFEALETVQRDYRIDEDRIVVRGFSLGGAACWHLATHHAWRWCAANPGAGFSETEQFLNFFQGEKLQPFPWERQLWNLYDSTSVVANLYNVPTVAYSGEIDRQKQAADVMSEAAQRVQLALKHVIGPKTAHQFEPQAKREVARLIDDIASQGRVDLPTHVALSTYTLKYNRQAWVEIDALKEHWKLGFVDAYLNQPNGLLINCSPTENVEAFTLRFPPQNRVMSAGNQPSALRVDRQPVAVASLPQSDGSWTIQLHREGATWKEGPLSAPGLRKKHNLQGPIDDAFMDTFLFVRPTGPPANEKAGAWVQAEMTRAMEHWRRHFRGEVRVKDDTAVTPEDIQSAHLILWGDPSSNALIARTAPELPITWSPSEIQVGPQSFPAADHALICIYPNPLNPERYLVLNSSFTFRDYDYLNNARQTPKLPDWAIIDLNTPPNSRRPGAIAAADFFSEQWKLKPAP